MMDGKGNSSEDVINDLKECEEKFRALSEASFDGIGITCKGKIIEMNEAFLKTIGYEMGELVGKDVGFLVVPEDRAKVMKHVKEGYDRPYEHRMAKKDGTIIDVEVSGKGIIYHGEKCRITAIRDITKRKKVEEELENIFNLSPDMIGVFTTKGKLIKINLSWEKILGYKSEEILKMGWLKLVHPNDIEFTNKTVEEQLKGHSIARFVNRYRHKDGSYKTLEWRATAALDNLVYATARDVTERKKAEEELKAAKEDVERQVKERTVELQKANKELKTLDVAKTDFLNTISHELKTPLTAMIAHLDVLGDVRRECISRKTERKQCGLSFDAIKRNNGQLNFLIDNLLEVARMQSKTFVLDLAKFNVRELVLEVVNNFLPSATQKKLKIYYSVDKNLSLVADQNRVREILNNLIDNAIKFTKKGKVTIRVKTVGKFVSIAVEDTGIGIRKKDMPNLFKKFFQVQHGLKRGNGGGTGLGLTIINKLMQLQGGKVFVKSQFGKGSTFTVKLPAKGSVVKKVIKKRVVIKKVVPIVKKNVVVKRVMKGGSS